MVAMAKIKDKSNNTGVVQVTPNRPQKNEDYVNGCRRCRDCMDCYCGYGIGYHDLKRHYKKSSTELQNYNKLVKHHTKHKIYISTHKSMNPIIMCLVMGWTWFWIWNWVHYWRISY